MKNSLKYLFIISLLLIGPDGHAGWKAGVCSRNITPLEPAWMAGYANRTQPSQTKLNDIFVKALAIRDDNGNTAVITTADIIGISLEFSNSIRDEISRVHKIPRESIFFNVSHTHYGPDIFPETYLIDTPPEYLPKIKKYREWLYGEYINAISQAIANLAPSELSFSSIMPIPFAVSRRFPDGKGGVIYRSGPSSYYTGGVRDDMVPVLKVSGTDGKMKAIMFGYACHPITLRGEILSGDYPSFAQEYIEKSYPGTVALFVQGCGGQLVPNARNLPEYAMGHGKALADAVSKALAGPQTTLSGPLKCAYKEIKLNFVPTNRTILEEQSKSQNQRIKIKAGYLLAKLNKDEKIEPSMSFPVQAIGFGKELTIAGIAGETVVEYSAGVKSMFKDRFMWVAGYSNYVFSYLPTKTILKEGGYEAFDAILYSPLPGPFSEDVEELVLGGVKEVVDAVTR